MRKVRGEDGPGHREVNLQTPFPKDGLLAGSTGAPKEPRCSPGGARTELG